MSRKASWCLPVATAGCVLLSLPARADRDPLSGAPLPPDQQREIPSPITDRFYVRGTFFDPAVTTTVRVDTQNGTAMGTPVSAERDLGLSGRTPQGLFEAMFRLRKRSKVRVNFFESNRKGDELLTRPILFGNVMFVPGDRATSALDWRAFTITYTYSFIRTDRLELGTGLALHMLEADARAAVTARQLSQEITGAGAFPTIPLDFAWRISRRFAFTARGQYLRASIRGFEGALADYHGDVQYRWKPNVALGAGYSALRSSLDVSNATYPGRFSLNVRGPEAFFRVSF
ncbi:MAG TPA: hypothetical protein VIY54_04545 [Steroidobacteraceae bacterium]